eukprot:CAMPEP_0185259064 /NCGR_PEP_ID=MMETSP1359-20130426/7911_1 /TAXON_ID=552665 /ORGANISM="Bigelowiella longifila, Strain CCMP242" /LENGTH=241 /DNA_ID=CAMNT_0027844839 /DNA_START=15 /DNA_END=737 /DNA_ORIENTATION=+
MKAAQRAQQAAKKAMPPPPRKKLKVTQQVTQQNRNPAQVSVAAVPKSNVQRIESGASPVAAKGFSNGGRVAVKTSGTGTNTSSFTRPQIYASQPVEVSSGAGETASHQNQASSTTTSVANEIPSGFFDDPEREMKARGMSHDFTKELSVFEDIIEEEKEKRERGERDMEQKLKNYRNEIEKQEAQGYQDTVSKMKKRTEEFKKRMAAKRKAMKKRKMQSIENEDTEIVSEDVDKILESIAW